MSRELHTEIEIDAPPAAVWDVLSDLDAYQEWNPFIRRIAGDLREGGKLDVRLEPPRGRGITMAPTVLAARPGHELRWIGHLVMPGIFDGEHSFRVEPLEGGRTRFVQSERFKGILVRPLGRVLDSTKLGFEQMNAALKERVEAR
jgi:hypothetical protein